MVLPATTVCAQFGLLVGVLALIMNIPMSTFYNPFLQGFIWLWLGIGAGAARRFTSTPWEPSLARLPLGPMANSNAVSCA
jgi:hypothetical protein